MQEIRRPGADVRLLAARPAGANLSSDCHPVLGFDRRKLSVTLSIAGLNEKARQGTAGAAGELARGAQEGAVHDPTGAHETR
jgi:hypothetical protein